MRSGSTTRTWRWIGMGLVLALFAVVPPALGGKPTKPEGGSSASGWIVYWNNGKNIMRPDGSAQESLDLPGAQTSRQRHNGKLWAIGTVDTETHTHPDGRSNEELYLFAEAMDEEPSVAIQLTNDTSMEFSAYRWENLVWGHGDTFVSWVAHKWETDAQGDPYVSEAGIYRAWLAYDSNGNIVGLSGSPQLVASVGTYEEVWGNPSLRYVVTDVRYGHDWSPDGNTVCWNYAEGASEPGYLYMTHVSDPTYHWQLTATGSGRRAVWSSRNVIAWLNGGIRVIDPDGGNERMLWEKTGNVSLMHLHWSHDGNYLAYLAEGNRPQLYTISFNKPKPTSTGVKGYPDAWIPD